MRRPRDARLGKLGGSGATDPWGSDGAYHQVGSKQPHAHIMFSERTLDGYDRAPQPFFARANPDAPAQGGAAKDRDWNRRAKVMEVRGAWADAVNRHLERAGHAIRVDHRSLDAQGLDRAPEPKLGPAHTQALQEHRPTEVGREVIVCAGVPEVEQSLTLCIYNGSWSL